MYARICEKHFMSSATVMNTRVCKSDWIKRLHELTSPISKSYWPPVFLSILFFGCFFTHRPLPPSFFLWCSEIQSQRYANLPTSFSPLPHLQTQIAQGQSQAFLYAEAVTGVTCYSLPVTYCSFPNKLRASIYGLHV